MGHVQEEQVASCFGGCKVSLLSPPTPPLPTSFALPSPRVSEYLRGLSEAAEAARPSPLGPRLCSEHCRDPPSPAPRPGRAEPSNEQRRAQPHRLFQPRLGAVHHLQRLKPHPSSGGLSFSRTPNLPPQITDLGSFETCP